MTENLHPSNDPTPEARKGDSAFLPVVLVAGIVLVVVFIAAILFLKGRQNKIAPATPSPTSQILHDPAATTRA